MQDEPSTDAPGSEAPALCPRCRTQARPDAKFCGACGTALALAPAAMARRHAQSRQSWARRDSSDTASWHIIRRPLTFYCIILATILPLYWIDPRNLATAMLIVQGVHAVVICSFAGMELPALLPLLRPTRAAGVAAGMGVMAWLIVALAGMAYFGLLTHAFQVPLSHPETLFQDAGYPRWVAWCSIALLPAFWEELAFRGLIQGALIRVLRPSEAVFVTAAIFTIIHRVPLSFPYLFALGLLLGVLRQRSGSVLPGMLIHLLNNTAAMFGML